METLATNVCVFCGSSQSPLTAGHAWPAWIRKRFELTGHAALQQRMKDVCEACNSSWMSRLEQSVVPILEAQMLNADPRQWALGDQRTLSVWAVKTTMVLELAAPGEGGLFFTDNERWLFMRMLEPPSNDIKVWAAASLGDPPVHYSATRIPLRHHAAGSHIGDALVATISAGRVAFQMVARRFFEPRRDIDDVVFPPEATEWQGATVLLWPVSESPRQWPPRVTLDAARLEAFANRWNEQMNAKG
jgi:hypothetical protein